MSDMIEKTDSGYEISDVLCVTIVMVNVCFVGHPGTKDWVLIDAGLWNSADRIREAAKERFGKNNPPKAIILTHGHFDHVGALTEFKQDWDVPIYAHEMEMPYLTGQADYPPPDPSVDDGLMAKISPLYPNESINLGNRVAPLPKDGSIPSMLGWRWIHTSGHTPGHVSLFREYDRILIAGDAFTTVEQESALAVITQEKEVHGPPKYFTIDWIKARESVKQLEELKPNVVISGHGLPLEGPLLSKELKNLAQNFNQLAIPEQGRYVPEQFQQ